MVVNADSYALTKALPGGTKVPRVDLPDGVELFVVGGAFTDAPVAAAQGRGFDKCL